jgi:hypothetical protein
METYELEGRDARSCRKCGYVDVPVRHEPESGQRESWDDAISRFQERFADVTVSEVDLPAEASDDSDGDSTEELRSDGSVGDSADEESSEDGPTEESSEDGPTEESSEDGPTEESSEDLSASESPEEASATDD